MWQSNVPGNVPRMKVKVDTSTIPREPQANIWRNNHFSAWQKPEYGAKIYEKIKWYLTPGQLWMFPGTPSGSRQMCGTCPTLSCQSFRRLAWPPPLPCSPPPPFSPSPPVWGIVAMFFRIPSNANLLNLWIVLKGTARLDGQLIYAPELELFLEQRFSNSTHVQIQNGDLVCQPEVQGHTCCCWDEASQFDRCPR